MEQTSAKDLVAQANREVQTLSAEEAVKLAGNTDVVFVDIREAEELQKTGKLKGAVHVPRGFLEVQVDPTSASHKPEIDRNKRLVLYCGSGSRSALGAKTLKDMGFTNVVHVAGGFTALQKAGGSIE